MRYEYERKIYCKRTSGVTRLFMMRKVGRLGRRNELSLGRLLFGILLAIRLVLWELTIWLETCSKRKAIHYSVDIIERSVLTAENLKHGNSTITVNGMGIIDLGKTI